MIGGCARIGHQVASDDAVDEDEDEEREEEEEADGRDEVEGRPECVGLCHALGCRRGRRERRRDGSGRQGR